MKRIFTLVGVLAIAAVSSFALSSQAASPDVNPIDAAGLKKEVAQRKGKVVIINFWATWCPPCRAEFPELVATQKKLASQGVELLTVSLDDRSDAKAAATFLGKNGVSSGAFINKNGGEPDLGYFQWLERSVPSSLAIPRTYILNRQGAVSARLIGGQSAADFEKAVRAALAGK